MRDTKDEADRLSELGGTEVVHGLPADAKKDPAGISTAGPEGYAARPDGLVKAEAEDVRLHQALLRRDPAAERDFVIRFRKLLHCMVLRTMNRYGASSPQQAEDLLQDAFVDLLTDSYAGIAAWRPGGRSLKNYVCVFVWRKTATRLRRKDSPQNQPPMDEELVARKLTDKWGTLNQIADRDALGYIERKLREDSSARDMRIFELSYVEDWQAKDIADALNISTALVFTTRYRMRKQFLSAAEELRARAVEPDDAP